MTEKQKRFCEEYLIDLNATQAAIRAGYSTDTANEQGARMLANVSIRARIDEALAERSRRTGVTADRVVRELAKIAFVNADDLIDTETASIRDGASEEDRACIASVKVKTSSGGDMDITEREIKLCDKLKALELLGKHLGMFTEKVEVGGAAVGCLKDILSQLGEE